VECRQLTGEELNATVQNLTSPRHCIKKKRHRKGVKKGNEVDGRFFLAGAFAGGRQRPTAGNVYAYLSCDADVIDSSDESSLIGFTKPEPF